MATPTAPVDITLTLNQTQVDYLWDLLETEFPGVTAPQAMEKLEKWGMDGVRENLNEVLRKRNAQARGIARQQLQDAGFMDEFPAP